MKRNLFIINTYFQLITAVNMSLNNFKNEINDIILTDTSVDIEDKIERLEKLNIFNNVYYIKSKDMLNNKLKKYVQYFNRKNVLKYEFEKYDEVLFYNFDSFTFCVIDELFSKNKNLKCSKFDEGFDTYTIPVSQMKVGKVQNFVRTLLRKKNLDNIVNKLYLYHPELICFDTNLEIEQIPTLDKNNKILKDALNKIFNYKSQPIKQKYIFFEESFFCDNKGIEDFTLIKDIINIVGKENIIIKLHPRNKVNRFSDIGVSTLKNIGIPWEVMQMNEDYSSKTFITISSGSILASKLYFHENVKTYLLYNCTEQKSDVLNDNYYKYLNKIKKTIGFNDIIIPDSKDEFIELLKKEK